MWLQEKTIVVIGGTTGLGLSAAQAFVREGARVVVVGRDAEHVEQAQRVLGPNTVALSGDATRPDTAPLAIQTALERWGRFDGLYHVAGGSGRRFGDGPLHEITLDGWNYTLQLNLTSLMLSNQAAVRQFRVQGTGGAVLNMGSVLGDSPSPHFFSTHAYAAAKSAIVGFSKSIAAYYASDNIRVNVLAPALVDTPMSQRASQNPDIQQFIQTKQPLDGGRNGQPGDLDGAAVYLLSDYARFTTGQVLYVDGGWRVSEGQHSH